MAKQLPKLLQDPHRRDIPEPCRQGLDPKQWSRKQITPTGQPKLSLWDPTELSLEKDADVLTCSHWHETEDDSRAPGYWLESHVKAWVLAVWVSTTMSGNQRMAKGCHGCDLLCRHPYQRHPGQSLHPVIKQSWGSMLIAPAGRQVLWKLTGPSIDTHFSSDECGSVFLPGQS